LYTTQGSEDIAERSFSTGINDYIRKESNISHYSVLENKIINGVNKYRVLKIFEKILKNIQEHIVIIDKDHNITYYNESFEKYLIRNNYVGSPISNIIKKEDKNRFYNYLINKEETVFEGIMVDFNEINHYVEIHKNIISNNDNYLFLNIKDVTNQTLKSDIESSSDDRFNAISNMSPDGIMTMNLFGYVTYINPAFTKLTGFPEEEIVGKHMLNIPTMKGKDMKPYIKLVKTFFAGKLDRTSFEFPYNRKDGSSGIGDGYINTIKVNGKRELIAIIKEVTDKKMKEEEYQHIFETSPDGILHINLDGVIKDVNQSAINILNIEDTKYIGKNISEIILQSDSHDVNLFDIYNKIILNNIKDPIELNFNTTNLSKWIKINASRIEIHEEILGVQIVMRDITQQKNIESDKKLYTDKLEKMVEERTNQIMDNEKMVTLAKISSMMAHDLKGPLQIINNSLYLLKNKTDDQEQYLNYIQAATKQATDLIEEMRIQGKEAPLKLEEVNIKNIIDESSIQVKVSEKVEFETIIKTNKKIRVDKSKFIRVFNNLLKNAIEAMPNGGKITIIVEEKQSNISLEVIDTGLGIPEEKLNNIFRPFQTTKAQGMGLGLSFCKHTIEAHGGKISVKSEQGKGTTFSITIPIKTEQDITNHIDNSIKIKDTLI